MHVKRRKALKAAGWKIFAPAGFLEMSDEERQLFAARIELANAIRKQRVLRQMTQKTLGDKLKTSQPRVARIERAAADVSLDQLVRALAAAGGRIVVKSSGAKTARRKRSTAKRAKITLKVSTSR